MSQTIDLEALVDFLTQARRETYAILEGDRNQDGTSQNAWQRDAWRYVDRYAGTNPYGGQEHVWQCAVERHRFSAGENPARRTVVPAGSNRSG